jgi:hypothetical protein
MSGGKATNMKCDDIYDSVINLDTENNYSLFQLAQCFNDGYDPGKLHSMLLSTDEGIVSDGLFVLREMGDLASNYAQDLDLLSLSTDPIIAKDARLLRSTIK